ncbi:hypothetical protein niasHS_014132 [Heterodera schachtii]|uniref:Uncharacterized protein n=2 Tax=Heterodera TaxID=34509 RepID=A0ABD2LG74_9BILA
MLRPPHFPLLLTAIVVVICSLSGTANGDKNLLDELRDLDIFQLKSGVSACPLLVGERCPESSPLYYFKCCGDLYSSCCVRLQDWAVGVIALLIVLILVAAFINLIRCIFCA